MSKIRKHVVMRNKALHLLFSFFMNKVSEYETRQLLQEYTLGRLNYKDVFIREIKKAMRPINDIPLKLFGRRNNILSKKRETNKDEIRNIDLIAYIFSNIKGFVEYQYIRRLTHDDIKNMSRFIRYEFFPKDSYVFRQGENSNKFYGLIDGEVQIVETKFTDKLKALRDLNAKLIERERLSDDDKIFFLSGQKYLDNYNNENDGEINYNLNLNDSNMNNNNNNKYVEDDITIRTKNYFVSKDSEDNEINYNDIDFGDSSVSSLNDNDFYLEDITRSKKRRFTLGLKKSRVIAKVKYYKSQTITKFKPNFLKKMNFMNNNYTNRRNYSDKNLNAHGKIEKFAFNSIKNNRKIIKEKRHIKINDNERNNINQLSKNLLVFGKILSEGTCIGDLEMCKKLKRNYSLYCLTDCHLFSLKKEFFDKYILSKIIRSELLKTNFILDKLSVISKEQHFFKLITKIIPKLYHKGQILYTPYDIADYLYLVYKGECAICEAAKNYDNKTDFLSEKPELKIISILNEGGIGGLEGYQKNVNYEKFMVVNSSLTIILKLDITEFDDATYRFRRSLEPLYYQQQRMIYSIQRKGLFFQIGREKNKNDEEKVKFRNDIHQSNIFKDKNKMPIRIQIKNNNDINNNNNNIKKNLFIKCKNNNKTSSPIKTINSMNTISNNYTVSNEAKIYSPIKIFIKQKKLQIEDTTSVLTSFIKDIKNSKSNNITQKSIIDSSINNFDESINANKNKNTIANSTIFKQKKYYSFYHQKFGRNPISLKGYFSQDKNDIKQINRFENIKTNIFKMRSTVNSNIFNFYKQVTNELKNNKNNNPKRLSWDKGKTFTEEKLNKLNENYNNKNNNILNIYSTIRSRKSSFKIKRYPMKLNSNKKPKGIRLSNFNKMMKLPSIKNNN